MKKTVLHPNGAENFETKQTFCNVRVQLHAMIWGAFVPLFALGACGGSDKSISSPRPAATADADAASQAQNGPSPSIMDVASDALSTLRGTVFYSGVYHVAATSVGFNCDGDFPIKVSLPQAGQPLISAFDFKGAELKCFGISLPVDKILNSLMTGSDSSPSESGIAFGIKSANGVIGLTQLAMIAINPYYPVAPDILDSDRQVLSKLNVATNVTITDPNAAIKESGQVSLVMNQFDAPYSSPSGLTLPHAMLWQITNTGFEKKILGPHLADNLEIGLSNDPVALTHLKIQMALLTAGGAAAVSIGSVKNLSWLSTLGKLIRTLGATSLGSKINLVLSLDLLQFTDAASVGGGAPAPAPAAGTTP